MQNKNVVSTLFAGIGVISLVLGAYAYNTQLSIAYGIVALVAALLSLITIRAR